MRCYAIEVYNYPYPGAPDTYEPCADDATGAEFEVIVFESEHDKIGERVETCDTRAEAEKVKAELEAEG